MEGIDRFSVPSSTATTFSMTSARKGILAIQVGNFLKHPCQDPASSGLDESKIV